MMRTAAHTTTRTALRAFSEGPLRWTALSPTTTDSGPLTTMLRGLSSQPPGHFVTGQ